MLENRKEEKKKTRNRSNGSEMEMYKCCKDNQNVTYIDNL